MTLTVPVARQGLVDTPVRGEVALRRGGGVRGVAELDVPDCPVAETELYPGRMPTAEAQVEIENDVGS